MWDAIWIDAHVATMAGSIPYGAIERGAFGIESGRIAWVGPAAALPDRPERLARRVESAGGGWITPGLIDCHTHPIYAGDRSADFEMALDGASYHDIVAAGGGILSTVRKT